MLADCHAQEHHAELRRQAHWLSMVASEGRTDGQATGLRYAFLPEPLVPHTRSKLSRDYLAGDALPAGSQLVQPMLMSTS